MDDHAIALQFALYNLDDHAMDAHAMALQFAVQLHAAGYRWVDFPMLWQLTRAHRVVVYRESGLAAIFGENASSLLRFRTIFGG